MGKKLYRSKNDRLISGVCGGLGEYSSVNSNVIRFIFVISTYFSGGISIFLYVILSNAIPEEGQDRKKENKSPFNKLSGFGNLINIINRLNNQNTRSPLKNNQNAIKSGELRQTINSQALKNEYSQKNCIELDGHQNRSGIAFDWRSKVLILLLIIGALFLLWKFGIIRLVA